MQGSSCMLLEAFAASGAVSYRVGGVGSNDDDGDKGRE